LGVGATVENIALTRGGNVFEHEHTTARLAVARTAKALRNASAQELTAVAAKEQLAFNLR
jgi:hypothetical protein